MNVVFVYFRSVSDNFYAVKGAALILPKHAKVAVENMQLLRQFGGELTINIIDKVFRNVEHVCRA